MEQQFTTEEEAFIVASLSRHVNELLNHVTQAISRQEVAANAEFAEQGIVFTRHSPANADYLTVCLFGHLFDRLHGGDRALAQRILTMEAKRLGITLHVE